MPVRESFGARAPAHTHTTWHGGGGDTTSGGCWRPSSDDARARRTVVGAPCVCCSVLWTWRGGGCVFVCTIVVCVGSPMRMSASRLVQFGYTPLRRYNP
eukprot:5359880-Prymnesium_polylepis.1